MKEKKVKKYGLFSNVAFILAEMFRYRKQTRYTLPLIILIEILETSITITIPAVAVAALERGASVGSFLAQMAAVLLIFAVIQVIRIFLINDYTWDGVIVRVYDFFVQMIYKCISMDYCNRENYENQKLFGKANESLNSDWHGVQNIMKQIPYVFINFFGMIIFGGAILLVDFRILLILLVMLLFNILTNRWARAYLNSHMEENTEIARKSGYLRRKIKEVNCGKDIRMYQMEKWFGKVLSSYVEQGQQWQKRIEKRFYVPVASDTLFIALRDGVAYLILIEQAVAGRISLAEFTLMIGVVSNFSSWLFGFVNSVTEILNANKLVVSFRQALDLKDSFKHGYGKAVTEEELSVGPKIELKHVTFRYGEEEKDILSDVNITIESGEKIALVGGNGAGKTTLVKLLCGFYHPTEGEILVNGVSIEEYDIEEYFKLIGIAFQDVNPIEMTLLNNVACTEKENADMDKFWKAIKDAGLYDKIQSLEKKEDTYIQPILDKSGIQLSGGENQKLMLARCLYKNAPFLILDEPTSALDPLAESEVYEKYSEMTVNKTSIFISHRLASTRFCDKILFLENGKIIEEGTHEELLKRGGRYAHIYEVQSHYYTEGGEMEDAYGEE